MSEFNPNSSDAVLSKILTELEGVRNDFKAYREDTETRLRALEVDKNYNRGIAAAISLAVSALVAAGIEWIRGGK